MLPTTVVFNNFAEVAHELTNGQPGTTQSEELDFQGHQFCKKNSHIQFHTAIPCLL